MRPFIKKSTELLKEKEFQPLQKSFYDFFCDLNKLRVEPHKVDKAELAQAFDALRQAVFKISISASQQLFYRLSLDVLINSMDRALHPSHKYVFVPGTTYFNPYHEPIKRPTTWSYREKHYKGENSEGNRFITNDDLDPFLAQERAAAKFKPK